MINYVKSHIYYLVRLLLLPRIVDNSAVLFGRKFSSDIAAQLVHKSHTFKVIDSPLTDN